MRIDRVTDLLVSGIQYVFSPPGLPLVLKGENSAPTTSVLVRGGAGVGKTTLAVALAHAIARHTQGLILYLTTESDPTELRYKVELLGLSEERVTGWELRAQGQVGGFVAQHLSLTSVGDAESVTEQKRGAIEAAWELVKQHRSEAPGVPIRAVVIDAFSLPEKPQDEVGLRTDVLRFIQSLEGQGISTVLIEEQGAAAADALSFVVDIVIELGLVPDPDTGELSRKLKCTKSRYAITQAGPHDYGLEFGRPAVWTDILPLVRPSTLSEFRLTPRERQIVFVPMERKRTYCRVVGGSLLMQLDHRPSPAASSRGIEADLRAVLNHTPGIRLAQVRCGPITVVREMGTHPIGLQISEGPFSAAWQLLRAISDHRINAVVIQQLDQLLNRKRFQEPLLHVLEALRATGAQVLVIGQSTDGSLERIKSLSDLVAGPGGHIDPAMERTFPQQWHYSAARLLGDLATIETPPPSNLEDLFAAQQLTQEIKQVIEAVDQLAALESGALKRRIESQNLGSASNYLHVDRSCILDRLGQRSLAKEVLTGLRTDAHPALAAAASWAWTMVGDDWRAAHVVLQSLKHGNAYWLTRQVWNGLCAIYADNDAAVAELGLAMKEPGRGFALPSLVRALVARGCLVEADQWIDQVVEIDKHPQWLSLRLKADARLESDDPAILIEARDALVALTSRNDLSPVQAAEIRHNLGIAHDRLGQRAEAIESLGVALALNPHLDLTRSKLATLGQVA